MLLGFSTCIHFQFYRKLKYSASLRHIQMQRTEERKMRTEGRIIRKLAANRNQTSPVAFLRSQGLVSESLYFHKLLSPAISPDANPDALQESIPCEPPAVPLMSRMPQATMSLQSKFCSQDQPGYLASAVFLRTAAVYCTSNDIRILGHCHCPPLSVLQ